MLSWSYPDAIFMLEKSIWGIKVYAMLALKELSEKKWHLTTAILGPGWKVGRYPKAVDPFLGRKWIPMSKRNLGY
jgi:hypothetical protein